MAESDEEQQTELPDGVKLVAYLLACELQIRDAATAMTDAVATHFQIGLPEGRPRQRPQIGGEARPGNELQSESNTVMGGGRTQPLAGPSADADASGESTGSELRRLLTALIELLDDSNVGPPVMSATRSA